ncbi:MAG: TonB family protein [Bacteroidaceae bacterium]|nr:TonB family protein [Bacteroidaceae bacterium]
MNNSTKNQKIISASVSIILHCLLFLLLFFLTLKSAEKEDIEDGIPVMLGEVEDAGGADIGGMPVPDAPAEVPQAAPVPEVADEPLITQEAEPTIAVDEAKVKAEEEAKRKAAEAAAAAEAKRKAEEEAARKKAEAEAAAKAAVNNKVAGAFGSSKNKGNSGNTSGEGAQGSKTGNANFGATSGVGGTGTSYAVGSRTHKHLAKPSYTDASSEGTVVVSIVVDAVGKVSSASIKSSTTTSAALRNAALSAARQSTFTAGQQLESGTITYKFKLK